jgi:hypothetical protein
MHGGSRHDPCPYCIHYDHGFCDEYNAQVYPTGGKTCPRFFLRHEAAVEKMACLFAVPIAVICLLVLGAGR